MNESMTRTEATGTVTVLPVALSECGIVSGTDRRAMTRRAVTDRGQAGPPAPAPGLESTAENLSRLGQRPCATARSLGPPGASDSDAGSDSRRRVRQAAGSPATVTFKFTVTVLRLARARH